VEQFNHQLNPKPKLAGVERGDDAASPKGECAAPGAFFPAAKGWRLPNRRQGVAILHCQEIQDELYASAMLCLGRAGPDAERVASSSNLRRKWIFGRAHFKSESAPASHQRQSRPACRNRKYSL
jgi:hypothetical protein